MSYSNGSYPLLTAGVAPSVAVLWPGGEGLFSAYGTFGGTTIKLQWSPDGGTTWLDADRTGDTYVTLTANGAGVFSLPPCTIRANVSAGTPAVAAFAASLKA